MNKKTYLLVGLIILLALPLLANNISIDGTVTLTDQSTAGEQPTHYTHIEFDISWDNSWRTSAAPNNWDAAWVFAKYKVTDKGSGSGTPDGEWRHCTLNSSGHTAPTSTPSSTIEAPSDGKGVFIYRSANGTGTNTWNNTKLRWNYGTNTVDGTNLIADDAKVDVKVFAIEMVYVPQANFELGDNSSDGSLGASDGNEGQVLTGSYTVSSSGSIEIGNDVASKLWGLSVSGNNTVGTAGTLSANYPNGYDSFYCMKYEISQGQYADFLNTLTSTQDGNRSIQGETDYATYRGTISGSAGSRTASVPNRACNYLNWADGAAYSDWAGLRPMTELEFEKACRGTESAVSGEYAWGNKTITAAVNISETEDGTETITTTNANCCYNNQTFTGGDAGSGPLRCGIFATGSSTTRQQSGASYYGLMEMSGNLWERTVTLGNATGREFTGTHGNGEIDDDGNADAASWPGTTASGTGIRGGHWGSLATQLPVSYRRFAAGGYALRKNNYGFRSARTQ